MTYRSSSQNHAWESQSPYLSYVADSASRPRLSSASAPRNSVPAQKRSAIAAIRTLIVAASAERRSALQKLLRGAASIAVVGALPATAAAGAYVQHWQPDAALIDLDLNLENAARLVTEASGDFSALTVVVLADHPEPAWTARMLR